MIAMHKHDAPAYALARRSQAAPAHATDGRTDGRTYADGETNAESLLSVSRAGGPNESAAIRDREIAERLLIDIGARFGERAERVRSGEREPISLSVRQLVFRRDHWVCQVCSAHPAARDDRRVSGALHLDHIIPWSAGGSDKSWNLRTLCHVCNIKRSNRVTGREKPAIPVVDICVPCHPRLVGLAEKPANTFEVYCGSHSHLSWAVPGWRIL